MFRQVWQHSHPAQSPAKDAHQGQAQQDSPAQDHIVIKEIDLDVLQPNGLIETLWNQQPEQPTQVWSVEQGHADLIRKSLQQRDQHCSRVLPAWDRKGVSHKDQADRTHHDTALQLVTGSAPLPSTGTSHVLLFSFLFYKSLSFALCQY